MSNLSPPLPERLVAYTQALLATNRQINLTAAQTTEQAHEILVVPSLGVAVAWDLVDPPRVAVDLGSGNGFPGVAVATLWPGCRVVLVERRQKKARAIAACLLEAGIDNARAIGCDAREIKNEAPDLLRGADLVTVRAVGSLADATALAAPLLADGGRLVHWKRATVTAAERQAGAAAARHAGLDVLPDIAQPVAEGILIVYARPGGAA